MSYDVVSQIFREKRPVVNDHEDSALIMQMSWDSIALFSRYIAGSTSSYIRSWCQRCDILQ